jgi:hypothetical protein
MVFLIPAKFFLRNKMIETTATEESQFLSRHRSSDRARSRKKRLCGCEGKILHRPLNMCLKIIYEGGLLRMTIQMKPIT